MNVDSPPALEDGAIALPGARGLHGHGRCWPGRLGSLPRNVQVATLTSFLTDISSEMLVWLLPLFLANILGAPTASIGLIEGSAETVSSLLKVCSGWLSDAIGGRRKWLAVSGYAISALAKPLLLLVSGWPGVFAVRIGDRIGKGMRTAPRDALIADSVAPAVRGLAFGVHRAGDTAGAVIGVLVALAVIGVGQGNAGVLSGAVFRVLVIASTIPAALGVLVLAVFAMDPPLPTREKAIARVGIVGLDRRFRIFLGIMVIFTLGNSSDLFLVLRAQQSGLSLLGVLGMVLSYNLVYAALSGPAGRLSDRIGRRSLLVAGWFVYALIYLGFGRISSGWQAWSLMTLYGVYAACFEGAAKAFVADLVPPTRRGVAYGVFHSVTGLAALPASLIAGILWEGIGSWPGLGPSAPFYLGACLAFSAALALMMFPDAAVQDDQEPHTR